MSNLTLGRGKVYFDPFAPNTQTNTGLRYIGNTPDATLEVASTVLDHYSSDAGLKVKDDSVILQLDRKGSFKTDEISDANMTLFLVGTLDTVTTTAATAQSSSLVGITPSRYYQLGVNANNLSGVRNIASVSVSLAATPNTAFVNGTDYTVDLGLGLIYINDTTDEGGSIPAGANLTVTYNTTAASRSQMLTSLDATGLEGSFKFVSYNPKGPQRDYYMPYVQLTPTGNFALKGDTWQEVSFNLDVLQLNPATPHIYMDGRPLT